MNTYSLSHLSDHTLEHDLQAVAAGDRITTAAFLAHVAEFDAQRLYLRAGYPSMLAYCVGGLHLSEDAACQRIRAARAARDFPAIFSAVADGRLHLRAVVMLAPHLTRVAADDLLGAAAHKTIAEIEQLLANRFPRPDLPARVRPLPPPLPSPSAGPIEPPAPGQVDQPAPGAFELSVSRRMEPHDPRPKVVPLAPERFAVQFTMHRATQEKLQRVRALLSHQVPTGDIVEIFDRALDLLLFELEKKKCGATNDPRRSRVSTNPRYVPAQVRRTVWVRDGGRCTFVSENGHRCDARSRLEFDHVIPVARGGQATVAGIRLRCRAHNQYEAERAFGADFMRHKREDAQRQAAPSP